MTTSPRTLGVCCFVGPLDRFGYQYIHALTVANMCRFGDRVFLISSTRNRTGAAELLARHENLEYVSDERTCFPLDAAGNEVFNVPQTYLNANLGVTLCRQAGLDAYIQIHVNQYVPEGSIAALRAQCAAVVDRREPYGWMYKRYQLGGRLTHADSRLPWIINLHSTVPMELAADSLMVGDPPQRLLVQSGDFQAQNSIAIVDAPLELKLEDMAAVRNFTRCYVEINPEANPVFETEHWMQYTQHKFDQKRFADESLSDTGKAIAAAGRPDFISRRVLANYSYSGGKGSLWSRIMRKIVRAARGN